MLDKNKKRKKKKKINNLSQKGELFDSIIIEEKRGNLEEITGRFEGK